MPSETILDVVLTSIVTAGLVALLWTRLNRLEDEVAHIRTVMVTKDDLNAVRQEMRVMRGEMGAMRGEMATKDDFNTLREDMRDMRGEMSEMRGEMAVMRSDLTHVALAVGANRPKPAEGETR